MNTGLVRILFGLDGEMVEGETLWVEPVEGDLYRIRNVPFYVYGLSAEDIVSAIEKDGRLTATGVVKRGGHSTYRVFLPVDTTDADFAANWSPLAEFGCSYERATTRCVGVDVPPEANIYAVYGALAAGERLRQWTFEEGHCGHSLRT